MVDKQIKLLAFIVIIFLSSVVFANEFTATVDRMEVPFDSSLRLTLELEGASSIGQPDVSALKKDFEILSTSRSSSISVINGQRSSASRWMYMMRALRQGEITIPSVKISTKEGELSSEEIKVTILEAEIVGKEDLSSELFVKLEMEKNNPYVGEVINVKVKLYTRRPNTQVEIIKPTLEDAIFELKSKPINSTENIDGLEYSVLTWNFHFTGMKAGEFEIPDLIAKGQYQIDNHSNRNNRINDHFGQFFSNLVLDNFKSFRVVTGGAIVNVQPAASEVKPWLPAGAIMLSQQVDREGLEQNQPFTRVITIHGTAVHGNQLPNIEFKSQKGEYKIYPESSEIITNLSDEILQSSKSIRYTIVPEKVGDITLPEIRLSWWNVSSDSPEIATLPSIDLVIASTQNQASKEPEQVREEIREEIREEEAELAQDSIDSAVKSDDNGSILTSALVIIAVIIFGGIIYICARQEKRYSANKAPVVDGSVVEQTKLHLKEVDQVESLKDLERFIRDYACLNWGMRANLSLRLIAINLQGKVTPDEQKQFTKLVNLISKSIYGSVQIDEVVEMVTDLKHLIANIDQSLDSNKSRKKIVKLDKLNPH